MSRIEITKPSSHYIVTTKRTQYHPTHYIKFSYNPKTLNRVVKKSDFDELEKWYNIRSKRLAKMFNANPADPDAMAIWRRTEAELVTAERYIFLEKKGELEFID